MEKEEKLNISRQEWDVLPIQTEVYRAAYNDTPYTKADFVRLCSEKTAEAFIEIYGNSKEDDAVWVLFTLCEWQCPETLIIEATDEKADLEDE